MGTNADHQRAWRERQKVKLAGLEAALRKQGKLARSNTAADVVKAKSAAPEAENRSSVTPDMLSMTAQERLAAVIRQEKRKLEAEYEMRMLEECKRRLNEISLPHYAKELEELERSIRNRKGVMNKATFEKIRNCLHTQRLAQLLGIPVLDLDANMAKRYDEAFNLFMDLEKRVLNEKESPTEFRKMPRTYDELMAMRAKVQAENRAKRAAAQNRKTDVGFK